MTAAPAPQPPTALAGTAPAPQPPTALAGTAAAAQARTARAAFKRQLDFSGAALREAVRISRDPEGVHLRRMPVVELLAAMPGLGPRRAEELVQMAQISADRRLAGLGHVQAERLATLIDARAARRRTRTRPAQP